MLVSQAPSGVPGAAAVMARAGGENFPVASRVLPADVRAHLLALYGFARLVDELGDAAPGDRLAALDWLDGELDTIYGGGRPQHPLMVRLAMTVHASALPRGPFDRLIEANRVDQRVSRYETWEQLRGYCALSADPVGELVLGVLGLATPELVALSDSICTALQLTEHCQDIAEDFAHGRVYMPAQDMRRFGVGDRDLASAHARPALRALVEFEVARAHALLDDGTPLIGQVRGRAKLAVTAFVAGGRSALEAIERAGFDVQAGPPRVARTRRALAVLATLVEVARKPGR